MKLNLFSELYRLNKFKWRNLITGIEQKHKISFYAHKDDLGKKELLVEHCESTVKYFIKLIENHNLDPIVDNFMYKLADSRNKAFKLKEVLLLIIFFHDIGKINPVFQSDKMENNIQETFGFDMGVLTSKHSQLGFFIILNHLLDNSEFTFDEKLIVKIILLLKTVFFHHSKIGDLDFQLDNNKMICEQFYYKIFEKEPRTKKIKPENFNGLKNKNTSTELFVLFKLVYSLMITSDFHATSEFFGDSLEELHVIDNSFGEQLWNNFTREKIGEKNNFNYFIEQNKKRIIKDKPENLEAFSNVNLNKLRNLMNVESENSLSLLNADDRLLYLQIPTGGGKTNISTRLAIQLVKKYHLKKIFYVFPFINIIEQAFQSVKEVLKLDENQIARTDSKAELLIDNENQYIRYLDCLFDNFPILFLSHVAFFDMVFRRSKQKNFNFHQLCNSVVIIDEIQAYNDKLWSLIAGSLKILSETLNVYFIVMSATLPKIEESLYRIDYKKSFSHIISENMAAKFCNNNNFKQRVSIDLIEPENGFIADSIDIIKREILNSQGVKKYLVVCNTIDTSRQLTRLIIENNLFNNKNIYLLNSTIIDSRRKEIFEHFKKDQDDKNILISTQSVEAGVDIDCDVGIREFSLIDSIEQVAGRINRNANKPQCKLYVIYDKENYRKVYNDTFRYKFIDQLDFSEIKAVIRERKYNDYYYELVNYIQQNNRNDFLETSEDILYSIKNLDFITVDSKAVLISGESVSVFVPMNFNIKYFSDNEIVLLQKENLIDGDIVSGAILWNYYKNLFKFETTYNEKVVSLKQLKSIISKYTFSLFNRFVGDNRKLTDIISLSYGYYYLENWEECYSFENGLNLSNFINKLRIDFCFI